MKRRTFLGSVAASTTAAALFEKPLEAAQAQPRKATRVTLLGTGTPAPSLQRAGSGYLVVRPSRISKGIRRRYCGRISQSTFTITQRPFHFATCR